ncbi:MAG: hypothetical protein CMB46_01000 [Euryarchaeota archaeon]|nr:hypothetical protein [Euryarchaeota archaeon]
MGLSDSRGMDRLLRHLIVFISVMTVLILLLSISLLQYPVTVSVSASILASLLSVPMGIAAIFTLRSRSSSGPWFGVSFLSISSFSLLISGITIFSMGHSFQGALYAILGISSIRRVRVLMSKAFTQWYSGSSGSDSGIVLSQGEVLATCPSCHSILAVIPSKLDIEDRCPSCSGSLIRGSPEQ